ncbi:MAG: porin family protein, partial [Burkholderiales bacterium]|nr:porin family protein [Burkholderiales bacterium]
MFKKMNKKGAVMRTAGLVIVALGVSATLAWAEPPSHRFYISLHGGAAFPGQTTDDVGPPVSGTIETEGETGYVFGGAIGYMLSRSFAIEAEVAHTRADPESAALVSGPASPLGPFDATGSASVTTGMVNLILGFPMGARWRPYIGAGAGIAHFEAEDVAAGPLGPLDGDDYGLGLQAIAGIDFALSRNVSLGARYKYLRVSNISIEDPVSVTNDIEAPFHLAEAVLTFHLGHAAEPPSPTMPEAAPPPPVAPKHFIIFFGFNKCNITAEADSVLSEAASAAKSSGSASVSIVGH